jgi:hypothetical protein
MKTTFDKTTRDELITRINRLTENNKAGWGKMTVYQMMTHCVLWEEMFSGERTCKRSFIGRLIGKMALKGIMKDEKPMMRNAMTSPELKVTESNGDISSVRTKWITMLEEHAHSSNPYFLHPFFGRMTKEQVGYLKYKHIDHHLRQFNS